MFKHHSIHRPRLSRLFFVFFVTWSPFLLSINVAHSQLPRGFYGAGIGSVLGPSVFVNPPTLVGTGMGAGVGSSGVGAGQFAPPPLDPLGRRIHIPQEWTLPPTIASMAVPEMPSEPAAPSRVGPGVGPRALARPAAVPTLLLPTTLPAFRELARSIFTLINTGIDPQFMQAVWANPRQMERKYTQQLRDARRKAEENAERAALTALGDVNFLIGRFSRADENYGQLQAIETRRGNLEGEALALLKMGGNKIANGLYGEGLEISTSALDKYRKSKNRVGQARAYNNIAFVAAAMDDFQKTIEMYGEAVKASEGQDPQKGFVLANAGVSHTKFADYGIALKVMRQQVDIAKKNGDFKAEGETLFHIADAQEAKGNINDAVETVRRTIDLLTESKQPTGAAKKRMANLLMDAGQVDSAQVYATESGDNGALGRFHLLKRDPARAQQNFENLLRSSRRQRLPDQLYVAHTGLGLAAEARNDLRAAERHFEQAMSTIEELRDALLPTERKNFFVGRIGEFFRSEAARGLARVRMKSNKALASIFPSEATRSREFADNLSQRSDLPQLEIPRDIREKDFKLQTLLASLTRAREILARDAYPERYDAINQDVERVRRDLKTFIRLLRSQHRSYAAVRHPAPVELGDSEVRPDEYVAMFDVLGEGVGVKLIKGKQILKSGFVPWSSNELEAAIAKFRRPFERAELREFDAELGKSIYAKLFGPIMDSVPKGTPIVIIPDGILALLPFESLVTGGQPEWKKAEWGSSPQGVQYLGDSHPVSYYQSLTALTLTRLLLRKQKPTSRIVVFADPVFVPDDVRAQGATPVTIAEKDKDFVVGLMNAIEVETGGQFKLDRLPETGKLAEFLKQLYGDRSEVFTGLEASKDVFVEKVQPKIKEFGTLVFATHGMVSNNLPGIMEPALVLTAVPQGRNGLLTTSEVLGLDLNADIAALTACQTGMGKLLSGEGVMSMGRAFQAAGAKSVLMSLWSVSESASVTLMENFFKHLEAGDSRLAAWTKARQEIRAQGFDHPFFWAPFILVGEVN